MLVFRILPLETLSEQRKSQLCRTCFMTVVKGIYGNNKPLLNKNSLRTIEAQFVPKRKNNEARPKFTGSYKTKRVYSHTFPLFPTFLLFIVLYCQFTCSLVYANSCYKWNIYFINIYKYFFWHSIDRFDVGIWFVLNSGVNRFRSCQVVSPRARARDIFVCIYTL